RRAGGPGEPSPQPALGRAAATGGDRAGAGQRAAAHPRRRAHRQPRHPHERRDHGDPAAPQRVRDHHRAGHPRGGHRPLRRARRRLPRRPRPRRPPGHRPAVGRGPPGPAAGRGRPRAVGVMLWASIRMALGALRAHKLRTALTMLGIIIGVGAVIAMVSVGAGAQARIAEQIRSLGSNSIVILPGASTSGGIRWGLGSQQTLTEEDARAIATEVGAVEGAAPSVRGAAQTVFANTNWSTIIQGVTPEYLVAREWATAAGKMFGPEDVDAAGKVAVLGQTVADSLFGDSDPVGQSIRIKKVPFTVVGVLEPKGQSAWGQDQDDLILIPISTAKKKVLGVNQS